MSNYNIASTYIQAMVLLLANHQPLSYGSLALTHASPAAQDYSHFGQECDSRN